MGPSTRLRECKLDKSLTQSESSNLQSASVPSVVCRQSAILYCSRPTSLKFSGTGRLIAAGSADGDISMWQQSHWQNSSGKDCGGAADDLQLPQEHQVRINRSINTVRDGAKRANNAARVTAASCDRRLRGHILGVNDVAWTPEDRYLISASDDKILRLWDVETGALLKNFKGHRQAVYCCTINPQGNIILSGSCDHSYRLWDLRTGNCFQHFEAHRDTVTSVDFSRVDGSCFITASYDGACRIYDLLLGKCLRSVMHPFGEQNPPVGYARFSPNGRYLLASYLNSTIKVWDFTNLKATNVRTYTGHRNERYSVPCAFVTSSVADVSASSGGAKRKAMSSFAVDASADFSPIMTSKHCYNQHRKTRWVVSGTEDGQMVWWDVQTRKLIYRAPCYADSDYKDLIPDNDNPVVNSRYPAKQSPMFAAGASTANAISGFRSLVELADTPSFNFTQCNTLYQFAQDHQHAVRNMTDNKTQPDRIEVVQTRSYVTEKAVAGLSAHPRAPFVSTSLRLNPYIRVWSFSTSSNESS